MRISDITDAALKAGLLAPRVIPLRKRDGQIIYQLLVGPPGDRTSVPVDAKATPDDLAGIINVLKGVAA